MYDHFKYLEHDDDPDKQREIIKAHKDSSVYEIITQLDNARANPVEDKETQSAIVVAFKRLIAKKLDFFDNDHAHYLVDTLPGYIDQLQEELKELERIFKIHRHKKDPSYSEKPSC